MKIIVWNSQDKCVADYHRLIRGCDVLCLLDCGQVDGSDVCASDTEGSVSLES